MNRSLAGAFSKACIVAFAISSHVGDPARAVDWQPSMRAETWDFLFSPGMPEHPTGAGDGWQFSFPRYEGPLPCRDHLAPDCPSVHYIVTSAGGPLSGRAITVTVEISGSPQFRYRLESTNTCNRSASVRLLIERQGDDFAEAYYRWWSNPQAIVLAPGRHTGTVPLRPEQWSRFFGRKGEAAPDEFVAALRHVDKIGMTFGGGCFFGHGVNVSGGESTFTLKDFVISR